MASRSSVIRVEPELAEAFNAAPKQQQERVKSVMRSALKLVPPVPEKKTPRLSKKESELFLKINRGLSEKQWQRLIELNDKIEESTITDAEHEELLRLVKLSEKMQATRLRAIIDLARVRKVTPDEMMRQLGLNPPRYGR